MECGVVGGDNNECKKGVDEGVKVDTKKADQKLG